MDNLQNNVVNLETPQLDNPAAVEVNLPIGSEQLRKWDIELTKYKAGKSHLEQRVVSAERWWKLRNEFEEAKVSQTNSKPGITTASAWLHNVINSKHADALEAYPQPDVVPREQADETEAWALGKILPVILRQNNFERVYDLNIWRKLKTGTAVYMVSWDSKKLNGLGDISVTAVDLLNIFWEPGITDIQDSKYIFHTEKFCKDDLLEMYPDKLTDKHLSSVIVPTKMPTDDLVSDDNKVVVIDVYYKKKGKLHYCKYVADVVLYSTENDTQPYKVDERPAIDPFTGMQTVEQIPRTRAEDGLYNHGLYPFVFDTLFPIEGSPAGYGYIDICSNAMTRIDLMNTAILKNTIVGATPRFFERQNGSINEEELLDLSKPIVHVSSSNLGEDSIRPINTPQLSGNYINYLTSTVEELRETSSNTETSTGSSTNGVTAASALAALQEAAGKTSKSSTTTTYRCFSDICHMVIELIRQFYDLPREFRITGNMGVNRYITFQNTFMQPQYQGVLGDLDLGYRVPIYDIEVNPEKKTRYSKMAQNELALQLYGAGFFAPQMAQPALICLNMMDFDGKDELMQQINMAGQQYQMMQMAMAGQAPQGPIGGNVSDVELDKGQKENKMVERARDNAQSASQPGE